MRNKPTESLICTALLFALLVTLIVAVILSPTIASIISFALVILYFHQRKRMKSWLFTPVGMVLVASVAFISVYADSNIVEMIVNIVFILLLWGLLSSATMSHSDWIAPAYIWAALSASLFSNSVFFISAISLLAGIIFLIEKHDFRLLLAFSLVALISVAFVTRESGVNITTYASFSLIAISSLGILTESIRSRFGIFV